MSIEVLLSTFDGAEFLAEQLDSLLTQRGVSSVQLVRDDGSSDATTELLERYANRYPDRFVLGEPGRLGVIASYNRLMERSRAPYIAFCDQDDVWKSDKLRTLLDRMQVVEDKLGTLTPILVHSDLEVVDRQLRQIHPSFWAYSGGDGRRHRLAQLLVSNCVTGCSMLANRALIDRAAPVPPEALMHDHWFALVASAFGHVEAIDQPLVAYRQHGRNVLGARSSDWRAMLRKLLNGSGRKDLRALQRQAARLLNDNEEALSTEQRALLRGFSTLHQRNWLSRRLFLLRHGVLRAGVTRNLVLLFYARMAEDAW